MSSRRKYVPPRHSLALIQMPLCGQPLSSGPEHSQPPRIDSEEGMMERKEKEKDPPGSIPDTSPRSPLRSPPQPLPPTPIASLSKAILITPHQAFHCHGTMCGPGEKFQVMRTCLSIKCVMGNGSQPSAPGKDSRI